MTGQSQIWFNGRLVPAAEAVVPVTAHALHYGSSVFEGIRAYDTGQGAAIFCLPQHVRRLFDSCRMLRIELPYSPLEIADADQGGLGAPAGLDDDPLAPVSDGVDEAREPCLRLSEWNPFGHWPI